MPNLSGLNVVITRPIHQSRKLQLSVESHQGRAILFPTLEIAPLYSRELSHLHETAGLYDLIIFTSKNAVDHSIDFLPPQRTFKIAAMGPSTAQTLMDHGIPTDLIPTQHFNSEHLLALTYFDTIANKNVLILSGEGGRDWLEIQLRIKGALVTKLAVYRRDCPTPSSAEVRTLTSLSSCIFIMTSGESLENLMKIMMKHDALDWLFEKPLLVISERIKHKAQGLGFKTELLHLSPNATEPAILERLIKWYAN